MSQSSLTSPEDVQAKTGVVRYTSPAGKVERLRVFFLSMKRLIRCMPLCYLASRIWLQDVKRRDRAGRCSNAKFAGRVCYTESPVTIQLSGPEV